MARKDVEPKTHSPPPIGHKIERKPTPEPELLIRSPPISTTKLLLKTAERHKKFWFYDGSIILHVEDTLFRVHKTVLSTHCEMFETLFSLPQSESREGTLEGCTVVQLQDSAEDMTDLLNALYYSSHFDTLHADADPAIMLRFISGILRLSTKYLNYTLRRKCIRILTSYIPTTFSEYNLHQYHSHSHPRRFKSDLLMHAIKLAKETNVPTALPYLFYCTARLSTQRILRDDPNDIDWRDKTICQVGRERLRHAEMSLSHSFLLGFFPAPNCRTLALCSNARGPHAAWRVLETSGKAPHPLRPYTKWADLNICEECVYYSKKLHDDGREAVWSCMPALFEMDSWEVLKKRQELSDSSEDNLLDVG
ncbi:hypothetical protein Moror_7854 [Moniliophthora roreri MCA 2997]|nr:hypothetical protein Moror_7854 [Moniliophthora roreri MCA 2997]KAI3613824.1 hypothetical protein WG66_013620 [Moniliophthora roreri]